MLIPAAGLAGAIFVVVADLLARTLAAPSEIPLGVVTALVGGPFFLWLLRYAEGSTHGEGPAPSLALEFSAVSFSYSHRLLLQDISLRIAAGEMVALLGPNGAGKSTLLKLASGVIKPRSGRMLLEGRDVSALGRMAIARRVAVVPQDFSVQFAYTVRQIVELGRLPHRGLLGSASEGDRTAVASALEATGLSPLAERVFNELSGGERQRALISLALSQATPVLLLDEPTAHLDIRHQIQTLDLLRRLNQEQGVTVLAALHDLNLAARYFPRLVLFSSGVVADGSPAQVLDEGILSRMYETRVQVGILRGEEHLSVLPLGHLAGRSLDLGQQRLVHVVAGGGSGELLMRALADARNRLRGGTAQCRRQRRRAGGAAGYSLHSGAAVRSRLGAGLALRPRAYAECPCGCHLPGTSGHRQRRAPRGGPRGQAGGGAGLPL